MDDLTKKINDLLSSPDGMQQIQSALAAFTGMGGAQDDGKASPTPTDSSPFAGLDMDKLGSLLSGLGSGSKETDTDTKPESGGIGDLAGSMGMLTGLVPLLSQLNHDDENTVLLRALRPYLHGAREQRLDSAISMMRLMRLLPLLGGTDLLKGVKSR